MAHTMETSSLRDPLNTPTLHCNTTNKNHNNALI